MRHLSLILAIPLALTLTLPVAAGEPAPPTGVLDLSAYVAELERWSEKAEALGEDPGRASGLGSELPERWSVRTEGGDWETSTRPLRGALRAIEEKPESAKEKAQWMAAQLRAMKEEALRLSAEANPWPPAEARATLDEILSRSEFSELRAPNPLALLWRRLVEWFYETLDFLLGRVRIPSRTLTVGGWIFAGLVVFVLLFWLARWALSVPRSPTLEIPKSPAAPLGPRDLLREAFRAAESADFRQAIRLAYGAGLLHLAECGALRLERARTPREYLRLIPPAHPAREPWASLTARFEGAWYGGEPAAGGEFAAVISNLEKLGCVLPSIPATGNS
jgi:hypothetical protein